MNKINIDDLTLKQKVGQLFMCGFDALHINDHALALIKDYQVGNIILFARNIDTPEQLFTLNQNLQKLAYDKIGVPLFISIDQEGGMVTRITNGATNFPGAMTITANNDPIASYKAGKLMGAELKALGININLAPVLDVNNNPNNPVIGVRSFSDNQLTVSEYGVNFVEGLEENVIATAKHFPGHGDTNLDSHLALPTINIDLARLHRVELVPFVSAIENGISAIMSSHINFPNLTENGYPTTLSHNCLTGLLREELGFKGLIVTDCMQMKAIQHNYTTKEATLMAIKAGANLICVSHSEVLQTASLDRVLEAANNGELPLDVLNERVSRVLSYKSKLSQELSWKYEHVAPIILDQESKIFAYEVVKNAATLVKGQKVVLDDDAIIIAPSPLSTSIADDTDGYIDIVSAVKAGLPKVTAVEMKIRPSDNEILELVKLAGNHKQVILCTYNANVYQEQVSLINQLADLDVELHIVAMRNPYDLHFTNKIDNFTCFYEYTPNSVKAFIEYIKGGYELHGHSPIKNV